MAASPMAADPGGRIRSNGQQAEPARFWRRLADGRLQCDVCPRECRLREGQRGFCFVRARHLEHRRVTFGRPAPVPETLEEVAAAGRTWLEITTLLIPGLDDSDREVDDLMRWVVEHTGPSVPLHFSAFHPDFRMRDRPATPPATASRCSCRSSSASVPRSRCCRSRSGRARRLDARSAAAITVLDYATIGPDDAWRLPSAQDHAGLGRAGRPAGPAAGPPLRLYPERPWRPSWSASSSLGPLPPHLGITLEVTTGVIGTVLARIAVGTWLGGRLADRFDPRLLLGPILVAGGVLALLVIPIVSLVASLGVAPSAQGILVAAGAAFFLPAAVLSAASPTVVKLQLHHLGETGSVVGRYSALGTAGAILGSFATGFVLVAALPTRPIVIVLGVALIGAGAAISMTIGRARGSGLPWLVLVLVLAAAAAAWAACRRPHASARVPISVSTSAAGSADGSERLLRMDTLRHALVDLDDPTRLEFAYTRLLGDVVDGLAPPASAIVGLHVGGGGFTLPRYIEATRPGSMNRVLELDPAVLEVAREELGLVTTDSLSVVLGDGRISLRHEPAGAYDLVIGDAFAGPAVPWHLTTTEFVRDVQRVLRPGGIYAVNIIDYPPLDLARAQLATFTQLFEHVAVYGPASRWAGTSGGNVILLASDEPFPEAAILEANEARGGTAHFASSEAEVTELIEGAIVLRDDYAPVDQLLSRSS